MTGALGEQNTVRGVRIAPDGQRAAIVQFPPGQRINNDAIWLAPFAGGPITKFTSEPDVETHPQWSADGRFIAFNSNRGGQWRAYRQAVAGGPAEPLSDTPTRTHEPGPAVLTDWSADGRFILATITTSRSRGDIFVLPVTTGSHPQASVPIVQSALNEGGASFAPDGQWMTYLSDQSGRTEVYVRSFAVQADGTVLSPESSRRLVSNGARGVVRWRRDGRELVYLDASGQVVSVTISTGGTLSVGAPQTLFAVPPEFFRAQLSPGFLEMVPDASRFLLAMPSKDILRNDLEVILNWR